MRNLGRCVLGILAVALRQPGSPQVIPFKHTLECIKALADFNMLAQYRSHTSETTAYIEDYLDMFHQMKDIFLECQVTNHRRTKIDQQRTELQHHSAQESERITPSKRHWIMDAFREEENKQRMDMIYSESHFILVKIHLLSHFFDYIGQFGNIVMYSTETTELVQKTHMKDE